MRSFAPLFAALLVLILSACTPTPPDPRFDEAAGAVLLAEYEQARSDGNLELALAKAEDLRRLHGETEAARSMRKTVGQVREELEALLEKRRLANLWDYQSIPVDGGGTQHTAAIYSKVVMPLEEGTPPPTPDARLILRRHPAWGDSVYLVLEMSALRCGPPCTLQLRFDDGEPARYAGEPADTGTGPALFIKDRARFFAAMQGAKRLRVELPANGALVPRFEFELAGFDPDRTEAD